MSEKTPVKLTRRFFLKGLGVGIAAALVLPQAGRLLPVETSKREPKRKKASGPIRTITFGDGTVLHLTDWGDYPMYSRATYTTVDI